MSLLDILYNSNSLILNIVKILSGICLLIGALECFAGYKIVRIVTAFWAFCFGAAMGVVFGICIDKLSVGIAIGIVFGIVLAFLLWKFYLVGVFFITWISVASVILLLFKHSLITMIVAIVGGILAGIAAVLFERIVIIISTALFGATLVLFTACSMLLITPLTHLATSIILWTGLLIGGIVCQYKTTENKNTEKRSLGLMAILKNKYNQENEFTFSEKKYPGMQRAYRNYCIKCGCELIGGETFCRQCGFQIKD